MADAFDINVDLHYSVEAPSEMILQIEAADTPDQKINVKELTFEGTDQLVHGPAGEDIGIRSRFSVEQAISCRYSATAIVERRARSLKRLPGTRLSALPDKTLRYLMPSRYCAPGDFAATMETQFGKLSGGRLIATASDWLHENLSYVPGVSTSDTTASDTFMRREGICRDYAHVLIAMARARGVPARFVACYAPDVTPQDFHAVAEVWLDGDWHLVDPTGMATPDTIVRIGVGLDAAEVAFLTVFGHSTLITQQVAVKRKPAGQAALSARPR